ncbi:ABC transporter ATP-binding protein [Rhizobium halophytocola]|uniref:Iron(III) transport system ATP-binding protein n=1 Tax=Rhizobium halophytocola TaxID=735519 RepID=A0ABS4DZ49_9HYPH|nr:iron(III) transport system ATP-binding protein [Rhizobium halophytocola]
MAKLSLDGVSKQFGDARPAVVDFSLDLGEGGFLALLGPSGCGKTTLLRMIAGFETPTGGQIRLGDRLLSDAVGVVPPERRNMAMVFQSYALWPHMSVAQNVGYPLKVRGISGEEHRRRVVDALQSVHLLPYAERRPADLSGGQRQRVALARCLVMQPDVVLLDEPLANLDRHLRQEMEETFRSFHQRSGATMIYVTHDQAEAMVLATDVAVMSQGRLLQMAQPAELYARPNGRLVGGLIGQGVILALADDGYPARDYDGERIGRALARTDDAVCHVDVLVRPQDVEVAGGGLDARVTSIVFEGERYSARARLDAGAEVAFYCRTSLSVGERLSLAIRHGWRLS